LGTNFYGSNDPTNSVKALKEVVILRIRLQSHQVHLTMLQYYNMQYTVTHKIHAYTKINLNTVKWAQCDKTQSRVLGLFICVCIVLCTIVAHNTAQNRPDNFPSYHPDNHHCSYDVYLKEGGACGWQVKLHDPSLTHAIRECLSNENHV